MAKHHLRALLGTVAGKLLGEQARSYLVECRAADGFTRLQSGNEQRLHTTDCASEPEAQLSDASRARLGLPPLPAGASESLTHTCRGAPPEPRSSSHKTRQPTSSK